MASLKDLKDSDIAGISAEVAAKMMKEHPRLWQRLITKHQKFALDFAKFTYLAVYNAIDRPSRLQ